MKKVSDGINKFLLLFFLAISHIAVLAQDSSSSSVSVHKETTTTTTTWYTQPWVWVVGAAVFIIILVALFRGNSNRTDVTRSSTTVIKDRDVV